MLSCQTGASTVKSCKRVAHASILDSVTIAAENKATSNAPEKGSNFM